MGEGEGKRDAGEEKVESPPAAPAGARTGEEGRQRLEAMARGLRARPDRRGVVEYLRLRRSLR